MNGTYLNKKNHIIQGPIGKRAQSTTLYGGDSDKKGAKKATIEMLGLSQASDDIIDPIQSDKSTTSIKIYH